MNFKNEVLVSASLLKEFALQAKKCSFAKSDDKASLTDQSSIYSYRPFSNPLYAGMIYTDQYTGNTIESGTETIAIDLVTRWRNQYYGGTYQRFWNCSEESPIAKCIGIEWASRFPECVSAFLKTALLEMPEDFPVRGPSVHEAEGVVFEGFEIPGCWRYENRWTPGFLYNLDDPFLSFSGSETIHFNEIEVYSHFYHGGLVRDKYFPITIVD